MNAGETDVDCGGRLCPRCGDGRACLVDGDCSSSNCTAGVCGAKEIYQHTPGLLFEYLNSPFYLNSFLHHNVHQNGMGASYLNLYPIMQQEFCDTVGNPNATEGRPPDCNSIDHDALLLGNCYCHYCLLQVEQPCLNNGVCNNYQMQGYNCSCPPGYHGDHCQFEVGVAKPPINFSSAFPWYVYKASPPPPPTPPPLLPPPTAASDDDSGRLALIIGLAVGGGLLLVVALAIGVYLLRSSAPPTRASNVTMDPKANNAAVSATSAASTPAATAAAETIEHGDAKGDAKGDVKGEAKGDAKGDAKRIAGTEGIHRL